LTPLVIIFGVGPEITAECSVRAAGASVGLAKVKSLFSACSTVQTATPRPLLVFGSTDTKWWDRSVLEDHVARADGSLRWVSEADADAVGRDITTWAVEAARPRRIAAATGRLAKAPAPRTGGSVRRA
jgi:hypothetical protein